MHIPAALQRDLRALTDALDDPDADLLGLVADLAASVRAAVGSYLGMSLLVAPAPDAGFTVFDDGADPAQARTSLLLSGPPADGGPAGSPVLGLVLYASVPGAFVDLAADAEWLGVVGRVRLDQHLPAPTDHTPSTYLRDRSTIDQALGVLVARGATLDDARARLGAGGSDRGATVAAARLVLAELDGAGPPGG